MPRRAPFLRWATLGAVLCAAVRVGIAQAPPGDANAKLLRQLYFQRDFGHAYRVGRGLVRTDTSTELRAWWIANMAKSGLVDDALAPADSLARIAPHSVWSTLARVLADAEVGSRHTAAVTLARQLVRRAPRQADFAWAYAYALVQDDQNRAAVTFVDSITHAGAPSAELLALEGQALARLGGGLHADSAAKARAATVLADGRRLDSANVDAYLYAGLDLSNGPGDTVAYALLRRAAMLAPYSSGVHHSYWAAARHLGTRADDSSAAEIARDAESIARGRPDDPGALYLAAAGFGIARRADQQQQIEDRLLREYPDSAEAEFVAIGRIQELSDSIGRRLVTDTARARKERRTALDAFIARPAHPVAWPFQSAYLDLFSDIAHDTAVSNGDVLRVVRGLIRYDTLNITLTKVAVPILLAERHADFPLAEKLAQPDDARLAARIASESLYVSAPDRAKALSQVRAMELDALGWVYFNEGRIADAEREISLARDLAPTYATAYSHLGRIAERRGKLPDAQGLYAQGYQYERDDLGGGHKNTDALQRLYTTQRGSADGFAAYVDTLIAQDRARRRSETLASRIADPKPMAAFALDRRGGGRVLSDSLRGKIAIVHFWGVWCGACVSEIDEVQKAYDHFKSDSTVVFLTIDAHDPDRRTAEDFMRARHLDFPVLFDDGYAEKTQVIAYPATWFVDREGRIAFTHDGASRLLVDEFTWRVEALRGGSGN